MPIHYLLFPPVGRNVLSQLPILNILLALFIFLGIDRYRKRADPLLLQIACWILIVSIVTAIPGMIMDCNKSIEIFHDFVAPRSKGILSLIDGFAPSRKPSLVLFIVQLLVSAVYVYGAVRLLIGLGERKRESI